jgi:hypothetical protein
MLNNWNIYSKKIEMKKVVKLTEQDLVHLVKKVMDEQRIEGDNRVEKLIRKGIGLMRGKDQYIHQKKRKWLK